MTSKERNEGSLSLLEAVETLSTIADLDVGHDIGIAQDHTITLQDKPFTYRTIHWLSQNDAVESLKNVKEIFRVILNYLQQFYNKDYNSATEGQTIEGIKTIMVLVGEAAKKLDQYSAIFHATHGKSVTELREYRQLQEFYSSRIARKIDEGTLGKWLLALTKKAWGAKPTARLGGKKAAQGLPTRHVFVDLESVKKDADYELFFLRKEDGTRFYSPRLIRNIKLVCDFGNYFGPNRKVEDPMEDVGFWLDRGFQSAAQRVLKNLGNRLERFYRDVYPQKEQELIEHVNKALMALMLASHPTPLAGTAKTSMDYFHDFQLYLRQALNSGDYHRMLAYPPAETNKAAHTLLEVVHGLCVAVFEDLHIYQELAPAITGLIHAASEGQSQEHEQTARASHLLWNALASDYAALAKYLKRHPNGPLQKVLEVLQDGGRFSFDPLWQQNMPNPLYTLKIDGDKVQCVHIPTPTSQEFINKAGVIEEFKGFLRAYAKEEGRRFLLFNFQDRTSWRDHERCTVLEELQKGEQFEKTLTVVSLPKETDFYNQLAPYNRDNHTEVFLSHFKEHLHDPQAGFYIPEPLLKKLDKSFVEEVLEGIHRVFFSQKNVLSREQRMDFIEIFYVLLELKILEQTHPAAFSCTCKDGVDVGACASAELFAFMKLIQPHKITVEDRQQINLLLHTPALLVRERVLQPERFHRVLSALRCVEGVREEMGPENFAKQIHKVLSFLKKEVTL